MINNLQVYNLNCKLNRHNNNNNNKQKHQQEVKFFFFFFFFFYKNSTGTRMARAVSISFIGNRASPDHSSQSFARTCT